MRISVVVASLSLSVLLLTGCGSVLSSIGLGAIQGESTGISEVDTILNNFQLSEDEVLNEKVTTIGEHLVEASKEAQKQEWTFYVLEDKTLNAFSLPSGDVFISTGILRTLRNDNYTAIAIGHEMAHILAGHGEGRATKQMLNNLSSQAITKATTGLSPKYKKALDTTKDVVGDIDDIIPFDPQEELEADKINIQLLYKAGYDVKDVVKFWRAVSSKNSSKNKFSASHPTDAKRIKAMEAYIKTLK